MRRHVLSISAANGVTLVSVAAAYFLYSRLLSPAEFGLYAIGLAIARIAVAVLDGGLKASIIKYAEELTSTQRATLTIVSAVVGVFILLTMGVAHVLSTARFGWSAKDVNFVSAYVLSYVLTYPLLLVPTASLERQLRYKPVAAAEAAANVIEYAGPAILWYFFELGMWSFVGAALLGRVCRVIGVNIAEPPHWNRPDRTAFLSVIALIREGAWYQGALGASMVRDQLHVLLIAPLFGKEWAGYYAWILQLCMVGSQVFVQTAARIAVPWYSRTVNPIERWRAVDSQIRWLAILTTPPLIVLVVLAPWANSFLFANRWSAALGLLPWLIMRMVPGLATAPLGALVLVGGGARQYFMASVWWTVCELIVAGICIFWLGPKGLAVSYAITAWVGIYLFLNRVEGNTASIYSDLFRGIFWRPALWTAVVLVFVFDQLGLAGMSRGGAVLVLSESLFIIAVAYLTEYPVRSQLLRRSG